MRTPVSALLLLSLAWLVGAGAASWSVVVYGRHGDTGRAIACSVVASVVLALAALRLIRATRERTVLHLSGDGRCVEAASGCEVRILWSAGRWSAFQSAPGRRVQLIGPGSTASAEFDRRLRIHARLPTVSRHHV